MFLLWSFGLEKVYAYFLYYLVYVPVHFVADTSLTLSVEHAHPLYVVKSMINNKEYSWSLSGELFLLPIVLLISWQIFLFLVLPKKRALKILRNNIITLVLAQMFYLFLLTLYWKSSTARLIHDMLNNNLIIITIFLIIKDSVKNHLFEKKVESGG